MCMLKMLFLFALLLLVNANNFSITSWNITNLSKSNGFSLDTAIQLYENFINSLVIGIDPILDAVVKPFSEAFKDCYWCYPPYPCLQIGGPYITPEHPISLPPYPPCFMNVTIELYTRKNPNTSFVFGANDLSQINQSNFDSNSDTKFLIGGYIAGDGQSFKPATIDALLARSNFNVFIVNWYKGSDTTYEQAVANVRMVGAILYRFIELLTNITGHPLTRIHLIGHSLGAHICGHVGEYLLGQLARISGMDPAGPLYNNTDSVVRLSMNDAKFVDITHTNAGSVWTAHLGIDQKIGHLDFYPNGGSQQPGCSPINILQQGLISLIYITSGSFTTLISTIISFVSCSHGRSILLYTESILNSAINSSCDFKSYACSDYNTFELGSLGPCHICGSDGARCAQMGFNADQYAAQNHTLPAKEKFFLTTNSTPPYCED